MTKTGVKIKLPTEKQIRGFCQALNKELSVKALTWYKDGFMSGGGKTDKGKWQPRKTKGSNPLLIKTGTLRKSIYIANATDKGLLIKSSTKKYGAKREYSKYINEGTQKMPAREFLGYSKKLNQSLIKLITKRALMFVHKLNK